MNCLTQQEIEHWLVSQSVTPAPYGKTESPTHYIQFAVPSRPLANAAFIRQFLKLTKGDVLIHVTDWPTYEPSEMAIVDALRRNSDESRNLIDAAGHLIASNDYELAIALFGHTGNFEWNSYLYLANDLATLYNWEGSRYDFWSNDKNIYRQLSKLVDDFELGPVIAG